MKNHIQVQVHLVPTDNQSYIALDGKELCLSKNVEYLSRRMLNNTTKPIPEPQHLYLTSDEEIKEGDWFLLFVSGRFDRFRQCKNVDSSGLIITQFDDGVFSKECRRIVATTNKELREDLIMEEVKDNGKVGKKSLILKISNDFIELYIKRYNEGKKITEVWLKILKDHTRNCGTKYRGCAPECTFHNPELILDESGSVIWSLGEKKNIAEKIISELETERSVDKQNVNKWYNAGLDKAIMIAKLIQKDYENYPE